VLNPLAGLRWLACFAVFGGLTLFPDLNSRQSAAQNSAPVDIVYFPLDALGKFSDFFAGYLKLAGEPSLLAAEHDRNVHAYRLEWLSAQHGYKPIVRLMVNAAAPVPSSSRSSRAIHAFSTPPSAPSRLTMCPSSCKRLSALIFGGRHPSSTRNPAVEKSTRWTQTRARLKACVTAATMSYSTIGPNQSN
jgi:hypothetical protein